MLKVKNVRTFGIEASVIAGGYPMQTKMPTEEEFADQETVINLLINNCEDDVMDASLEVELFSEDDLKAGRRGMARTKNLGKVPTGTGHDNVLKGMIVQHDVLYPQYWTPQFQRYSFHDIVSSNSKMHRLSKMSIEKMCNKYVDDIVIENLKGWIGIFNGFKPGMTEVIVYDGAYFDGCGGEQPFQFHSFDGGKTKLDYKGREVMKNEQDDIHISKEETYSKYEIFMKVVSNAPLGLEQYMRVTSNYLQLKTIYLQRKDHKLKEDWGSYCAWCESLPMFVEFALQGERQFTDKNGQPLKEIYDWR